MIASGRSHNEKFELHVMQNLLCEANRFDCKIRS